MESFVIGENGSQVVLIPEGYALSLQSGGPFSISSGFFGKDVIDGNEANIITTEKDIYINNSIVISDPGYYYIKSNAFFVFANLGTVGEISGQTGSLTSSNYMSNYYFLPPNSTGITINELFETNLAIARSVDGYNNIGLPSFLELSTNAYWEFNGKFLEVYILNNSSPSANGANIIFLGSQGVVILGDPVVTGVKTSDVRVVGESAVFRMRKNTDTEFQFIRMS